MKKSFLLFIICCLTNIAAAQDYNQLTDDGTFTPARDRQTARNDSLKSQHKEIPKGFRTWTIDSRFGDRTPVLPDTASYLFMNTVYTSGMYGEYNFLGNLGSPRYNRIFMNREPDHQFLFIQPFSYFIKDVEDFHFTNTYSPITNLTYNTCGDRTNGEDHLTARFAVNAGRKLGVGFLFDYLYGRGYYQEQNTSLFDYTMYGSYLGDRYQAHLLASINHQKQAENGGIANDNYITRPESFNDDYKENEIPTVLAQNWNRNDNQHIFFNHRYSIGFHREVPMTEEEIKAKKFALASEKEEKEAKEKMRNRRNGDMRSFEGRPEDAAIVGDESLVNDKSNANDSIRQQGRIKVDGTEMADSLLRAENVKADTTWTKREYVPVTSFIHTVQFDNYRRIYQAFQTPENFYLDEYYNIGRLTGDSIYDKTRHYDLKNTFAVALLEGFNKWAKAGVKLFLTHDLRHFTLPDSIGGINSYNEQSLTVGGQISKREGNTLHYDLTGELGVAGDDAGEIMLDANADVNIPLFGDTLQIGANAFFHRNSPIFYYRHYHARHAWWDNDDLDNITHSRIAGSFLLKGTETQLTIAADNINNYTYFGVNYSLGEKDTRLGNTICPRQASSAVNVFSIQLNQPFALGPVHLDLNATYQHSSNKDVLPLPALNLYANLYFRFKIARVLRCDLGADLRYFTKYAATEYVPYIGQFAVNENKELRTEIGNYPYINIYANFHLKQTRFFVMIGHVNAGSGNNNYFLTPHYPTNGRIIRFGLSWNFFN